ncbi:MAG: hypothetical protein H8E62_10665 [Planctomycetes bacterium]|nr:hypothetical protein [Planctomycetota bacterium]
MEKNPFPPAKGEGKGKGVHHDLKMSAKRLAQRRTAQDSEGVHISVFGSSLDETPF